VSDEPKQAFLLSGSGGRARVVAVVQTADSCRTLASSIHYLETSDFIATTDPPQLHCLAGWLADMLTG
jgi:hypothetical protein